MAGKKHTGEFPVYTQFFSTRMCRVLKCLCNLESRASKIGSLILSVEELYLVQVSLCDIDLNLYCLCYIYILDAVGSWQIILPMPNLERTY